MAACQAVACFGMCFFCGGFYMAVWIAANNYPTKNLDGCPNFGCAPTFWPAIQFYCQHLASQRWQNLWPNNWWTPSKQPLQSLTGEKEIMESDTHKEQDGTYELTCSSVRMKLSWKMTGQTSLVTYKIDIHGSLLNIFAH